MGSMSLASMKETNEMLGLSDNSILFWHLEHNHYPGIGEFIEVAKAAIEHANCLPYGEWGTINIAKIMGDNKYSTATPVEKILEAWHLQDFLENDEDCYDE